MQAHMLDLTLPAVAASVARARTELCDAMAPQLEQDELDTLRLLVSELVTNAVRHAKTEITIELTAEEGALHLEVFDRGDGRPVFLDPDPGAPGGLGLPIVEALASSWGMRPREGGGKGVWAEVRG